MKHILKATSIVEALVAAVIFLTVFMVAMNAFTNLSRIGMNNIVSPVEVEDALWECIRRFEKNESEIQIYEYRWGSIEVKASPIGMYERVEQINVTAYLNNGRTICYRKLRRL